MVKSKKLWHVWRMVWRLLVVSVLIFNSAPTKVIAQDDFPPNTSHSSLEYQEENSSNSVEEVNTSACDQSGSHCIEGAENIGIIQQDLDQVDCSVDVDPDGKCYLGCWPTAAGTLIKFWQDSFPNLWQGNSETVAAVRDRLSNPYDFVPVAGEGWLRANGDSLAKALQAYWDSYYSGAVKVNSVKHSFEVVKDMVDAGTPFGIDFDGHARTGIGYREQDGKKEIIVLGNLRSGSSPELIEWDEGWRSDADGAYRIVTVTPNYCPFAFARLEAVRIRLVNVPANMQIEYKAHIQHDGWQDWVSDGEMAGTTGEAKRLEAIQIRLKNKSEDGCKVRYRAKVEGIGWEEERDEKWPENGEEAGTTGQSRRIEALEIEIVDCGRVAVEYEAHFAKVGWLSDTFWNGETAGLEDVVLYQNINYGCWGDGESEGYVKVAPGESASSLPFDPLSIKVPRHGYEVVLNDRYKYLLRDDIANISDVEKVYVNWCPQSPRTAILYQHPDYRCGGVGNKEGYLYIPFDENNAVEVPFGATSIQVASGYYAKLCLKSPEGVCVRAFGDIRTFVGARAWNCRDDTYRPIRLDDNVKTVQVLEHEDFCPSDVTQRLSTSSCTPNSRPYQPVLDQPNDGHVALDYLAPTLCWKAADPDGDQLEYFVETYDSPINLNSGWIQNNCWRPKKLDNQYYTYQWRVKSRERDAQNLESDWSTTRSFTIAAPNRPPNISFDKANGQDFSERINTRDQDWTFEGTASDHEGRFDRVEFRCDGDNCGTGDTCDQDSSWSISRTGMAGKNEVYFKAYDAEGYNSSSRRLTLYIDLAAPTTQISLNGDANPAVWPTWFTEPVNVVLKATDQATGHARVGVREIHYQLDGGSWQTRSGSQATVAVSSDGEHTLSYYAVDKVGNTEATRTVTFKIDQTPPTLPSGAAETHGATHNVWQRDVNAPTFTWDASTDAGSGLWGYEVYFGVDPQGTGLERFLAGQPRVWTPQPAGVPTDDYYLRARARDHAGNWTPWVDLFTFKYDGTPPENPEVVTHTAGIVSTIWQRSTRTADFLWPIPHDEGSGVKGYYAYWGADPEGTDTRLLNTNSFSDPTPLCALDAVCTGYFRLRSVDNVDNLANEWSTGFVLRYDNVPPTVTLGFYGGITTTNQTQVLLDVACDDGVGSGCKAMRFSTDGVNWMPWEVYTNTREWTVPPISRRSWPVFVQVRDGVGLESGTVSNAIYLDTSWQQPRSANFRLFDEAQSSGAGAYTSANYTGRGTLAQMADTPAVSSTNYIVMWGYEAGSQAVPLVVPGHDVYNFINGAFASGTGAEAMTSSQYMMLGVLGEAGLPTTTTTLSSGSFQHQPGFLASTPARLSNFSAMQMIMEAPPPEPGIPCETPYLQIGDGVGFTTQPTVTLILCAPKAMEMMVSSNVSFTHAVWEPYAITRTWTLPITTSSSTPQYVYALFKNEQGALYETYFDSVIYDTSVPSLTLALEVDMPGGNTAALRARQALHADEGVPIYVKVYDDDSHITEMIFSDNISFTGALREPFAPVKLYTPPSGEDGVHTVYVRVYDQAGNASPIAQTSFTYDTQAPNGGISFGEWAVGAEAISATVYFGAWDAASDIDAMRVSYDPALTDAAWQPYTDVLVMPLLDPDSEEGAYTFYLPEENYVLYAQYRDAAGRISEIYSDTLHVDTDPPVVYVDIEPGETWSRTVTFYAYDDWSDVAALYVSNDPLMASGLVTFTDAVTTTTWTFDDNRIVWVQTEDSVGNVGEPYPAYAWETPRQSIYLPLVVRSYTTVPVRADFLAAPKDGPAPLTVVFTDTSTGIIDQWLWAFGDGITSTQQHPRHTYAITGTYTVSLTVDREDEQQTLMRTDYIYVTEPK